MLSKKSKGDVIKQKKLYLIVGITTILIMIGVSAAFGLTAAGAASTPPRRPLAIMVENSMAARPQSGLNLADIVFEAVDEYGITRFVAIYYNNDAAQVGPVRSSRPYYAEIARGFDPLYAFFGTYPENYKYIQDMNMYTLSAMTDNSGQSSIKGMGPYWRDYKRSKIQEHTAFMSTYALRAQAAKIGYPQDGGVIPLNFKSDAGEGERGGVARVNIDFGTASYAPKGFNVNYIYNRGSNSYARVMGNKAHVDYNTGQQITAKNVIVMITDIVGPIDQWKHMSVRTIGSGSALMFLDGNVIQGSWERGSVYDPFIYRDGDGNEVNFNAGATWIHLVQDPSKVSFQ